MSVYKRIDSADISIKNFPLYKQWDISYNTSSNEFTNNINSIDVSDRAVFFKGTYQTYPISTVIPAIAGFLTEPTTSLSITQRGIYDFLNVLYNKPLRGSNEYNYVLDDPINNLRELYQNVYILKIHQDIYGYKIKENSFEFISDLSSYVEDGYVDDGYADDFGYDTTIKDDGEGNLYDTLYPETDFLDNQNRLIYLSFGRKYKSYYDPNNNFILTQGLDTFRSGTLEEIDESYFQNDYQATDIYYRTGSYGIRADFISGSIKIPHDFGYNLDTNPEFGISFIMDPGVSASYSSSKVNLIKKGYQIEQIEDTTTSISSYPYSITYDVNNKNIEFSLSDGPRTFSVSSSVNSVPYGEYSHIICQKTGSSLYIHIDSYDNAFSSSIGCIESCSNKSPIYVGYNPLNSNDKFKGTLEQLSFFDNALNETQIDSIIHIPSNIWQIGKIIYSHGLIILTNPQNQYTMHFDIWDDASDRRIKYKSTKYISENEYICRVKSYEYNYTYNKTIKEYKQLSCATGSSNIYDDPTFNPYITTIGLYNDNYDLLAVAKVAAPIRIPPNHDINFAVKFDI